MSERKFFPSALPWVLVTVAIVVLLFSNGRSANVVNADIVTASTAKDDYSFLTFRRNLWVIQHSTGHVRFYTVPESDEQPLIESRDYVVDRNLFPADSTSYQVSERNITNYLWIMNEATGKARYIKARRDGNFDESPLVDLAKTP